MKKLFVIFILFNACFFRTFAQNSVVVTDIENLISAIFEQYSYETETEIDVDSNYETLMNLYHNPIDLNVAERENLEDLFFLSQTQIENILFYRYKTGEFHTIYELLLVDGIDMTDIRRLLPFVIISRKKSNNNKANIKSILKYGKNEIYTLNEMTCEDKEGYKNVKDNSGYVGGKLHQILKYRFSSKDNYFFNITAEKDAGEQFWGKYNRGYDFVSSSFQIKTNGFLRNLILGDYQVNFGQGLTISHAFKSMKSSNVTNIIEHKTVFKRYSSTNEYNFFRGCATSLKFDKFNLNLFYSNKQIDANLNDDVVVGFYQTGYHRTVKEIAKIGIVNQQVIGLNLIFAGSFYRIGINGVGVMLDKPVVLKSYPYNLFYFRGNNQWSSSVNYQLKFMNFNVAGETAILDNKSCASLTSATFSPSGRVNIAILMRYYSPEYNSLFASAFAETSNTSNESGVYMGVEVFPAKKWKFAIYADTYRFPWLRYGINFPSYGNEIALFGNYNHSRNLEMNFKVKFEQSEVGVSSKTDIIQQKMNINKLTLRSQMNYSVGIFKFKQQIDANLLHYSNEEYSYGISAFQEISASFNKIPLKMNFRYTFFDVQNYDNRIYNYERDVLYVFSVPMLYGLGSRYYANLSYEVTSKLSVWLKISQTMYADYREFIGSGNETIIGNRKTDIRMTIRQKF
ncbi:helix-hairpin-helix domain-containing protein [Paludibacter sp.]